MASRHIAAAAVTVRRLHRWEKARATIVELQVYNEVNSEKVVPGMVFHNLEPGLRGLLIGMGAWSSNAL